jgi:hypothetical protein
MAAPLPAASRPLRASSPALPHLRRRRSNRDPEKNGSVSTLPRLPLGEARLTFSFPAVLFFAASLLCCPDRSLAVVLRWALGRPERGQLPSAAPKAQSDLVADRPASGGASSPLPPAWKPKRWAAIARPDLRRSGRLSPEDHGDPYHAMRKFITILLNRS